MYDPIDEDPPPPTPNRRKSRGSDFLGNEEDPCWNMSKPLPVSNSPADSDEVGAFSERSSCCEEAVMGLMITDTESTSSSSPIADLDNKESSDMMEVPDLKEVETMECLPFQAPSFAASSIHRPSHRHVSLSLACARFTTHSPTHPPSIKSNQPNPISPIVRRPGLTPNSNAATSRPCSPRRASRPCTRAARCAGCRCVLTLTHNTPGCPFNLAPACRTPH